jgi:hypothetical protein
VAQRPHDKTKNFDLVVVKILVVLVDLLVLGAQVGLGTQVLL